MGFLSKWTGSAGPAAIITSAFIGPGTIIVSTKAGAAFGFSLLWAAVFAVASLMFLMETAARISLVSGRDLVEASAGVLPGRRWWSLLIRGFILLSVLTICFAFQAGNLTGGSLGLADAAGVDRRWIVLLMTAVVLVVTFMRSMRSFEAVMKFFVGLMGLIFVLTMFFVRPDAASVARGLVPSIPDGAGMTALALVGTTLIGINLILHSIITKARWRGAEHLGEARRDILLNISVGGLITIALVVTAATLLYGGAVKGNPALAFTQSLEPVLGRSARVFGDVGLFAAGLSSAIAVPFTLKSISASVFNFRGGADGLPANALALAAILFGAVLAWSGRSPLEIVMLAQATSGLFLPFITVLILVVANDRRLLGEHANGPVANAAGLIVVALTILLGANGVGNACRTFMHLFG